MDNNLTDEFKSEYIHSHCSSLKYARIFFQLRTEHEEKEKSPAIAFFVNQLPPLSGHGERCGFTAFESV